MIAIELCNRNQQQPYRGRQYYDTILSKYASLGRKGVLDEPFHYTPKAICQGTDETNTEFQERLDNLEEKKTEFNRISDLAFELYQQYIIPNDGLLPSRTGLCDILAESFNSTLPTNFKNMMAATFQRRQECYLIVRLQPFLKCKVKQMSQYCRRIVRAINYGIDFPWSFLELNQHMELVDDVANDVKRYAASV